MCVTPFPRCRFSSSGAALPPILLTSTRISVAELVRVPGFPPPTSHPPTRSTVAQLVRVPAFAPPTAAFPVEGSRRQQNSD
jgi:hypothetical protein